MYVCVGIREVCHANMCEYACGVAGKDCMVYSAFHATHISTHAHVREVSRMSVCVCVCVCLCVCVCVFHIVHPACIFVYVCGYMCGV